MSQEIDYQAEIAKCNTMEDITGPDGLIQKVIKDAVEQVLRKVQIPVERYAYSEITGISIPL